MTPLLVRCKFIQEPLFNFVGQKTPYLNLKPSAWSTNNSTLPLVTFNNPCIIITIRVEILEGEAIIHHSHEDEEGVHQINDSPGWVRIL